MFCAFLAGSDFYQAIFTNTDMTDIDATNGLFVGVDLSSNVVLTRALFSKADLSYADLSNTILLSTNFTNACLKVANLQDTKVDNSLFVNADIKGANISNVDFSTAVTRGIKYNDEILWQNLTFINN